MNRRRPKPAALSSEEMLPVEPRPEAPVTIVQPVLLLVEGKDCELFTRALVSHLKLGNIQIVNFGGVEELGQYLKTLSLSRRFETVKTIGILRDAERSAADARRSVEGSISAAGFKSKARSPRFQVFILPDNKSPGMLETLCWRSVKNDPFIPCVEELLVCAEKHRVEVKNPDKTKTCAFLATRPDYKGLVGRAAQKGVWPWSSPAFEAIRKFLEGLDRSKPASGFTGLPH
ncbi:MAG: hypothetical protein IT449_15960 [Phycisphaerales bacterium]|nr:hypothetical protein [Phycisphaerales bacterium]